MKPGDVRANRALLRQAIGARPVFLQQVHGTRLLPLDASHARRRSRRRLHHHASGVACTIMVADCLPVLFTDESGTSRGRRACRLARPGGRGARADASRASARSGRRRWPGSGPASDPMPSRSARRSRRPSKPLRPRPPGASSLRSNAASGWPICRPGPPAPSRGRRRCSFTATTAAKPGARCQPVTLFLAPAGPRQRALRGLHLAGLKRLRPPASRLRARRLRVP